MSETKHTPGKWFDGKPFNANITGRGPCYMFGIGNGSVHIGYVSITKVVQKPEAEANAALICAAPELLAACKVALDVLDYLDGREAEAEQCRLAIQKAEGR